MSSYYFKFLGYHVYIKEDDLGILRVSRISAKAYAIDKIKKQLFFGKEKGK